MVNNSDSVNLVGIYHPPPSTKNPPNSVFMDEFSVFLSENIMHLPNLVITGDIKMRVNDSEDHDVNVFTDTMHSLGLDQHVDFQNTQRKDSHDKGKIHGILKKFGNKKESSATGKEFGKDIDQNKHG